MKRLIVLSAALTIIASASQAQFLASNSPAGESAGIFSHLKTSRHKAEKKNFVYTPPAVVQDQFYVDFGDVGNVVWSIDGPYDVAGFVKDGIPQYAYYDYDNELVGVTHSARYDELPAKAKAAIEKEYGDYAVEDIVYFKDNQANDADMYLFDQAFEDADNYFVELSKPGKTIVVKCDPEGNTEFFRTLH
jgi:hypothetical protein